MSKTLDRKLVQRSEEPGEEMDKKVGGAGQKDDSTSSAGGSNNDDTNLLASAPFDTYFIISIAI